MKKRQPYYKVFLALANLRAVNISQGCKGKHIAF
jgi:hypothetical protein